MSDMLRHHPDTARHPQKPSRHPLDTPIFGLHAATGRKSNIWIPWYSFNFSHFIWHLPTPVIFQTRSVNIQTLPEALRHHPNTPQKPPYFTCMRPLGERVISEYHHIYSTGLNLYEIYPPQTSAWHTQIPSWHCQTPSDTIQTPLRNLNFTVIGLYRISILLVSSCQSPRPTACAATTWTTSITSHQTLYAVYIAHIVHRNVSTAASSDPSFYSPNMSLTSLVSSLATSSFALCISPSTIWWP